MVTRPVAAGLAAGFAFVLLFSVFEVPVGLVGTEGVIITMERTICFGACPAYSLIIYDNGTLIYEGFAFVAVTGTRTAQIPQDKFEQIVEKFYEINYFSLEDRYEEPVSDLPSTTTSITVAGVTKSVYRYGFGPEELVQLENFIDELVGTERWIKGAGEVPVDLKVEYSYGYGGT
ncbi:MAG: DUF6438 domain-containing protein [Nitrososphaera sp.]